MIHQLLLINDRCFLYPLLVVSTIFLLPLQLLPIVEDRVAVLQQHLQSRVEPCYTGKVRQLVTATDRGMVQSLKCLRTAERDVPESTAIKSELLKDNKGAHSFSERSTCEPSSRALRMTSSLRSSFRIWFNSGKGCNERIYGG